MAVARDDPQRRRLAGGESSSPPGAPPAHVTPSTAQREPSTGPSRHGASTARPAAARRRRLDVATGEIVMRNLPAVAPRPPERRRHGVRAVAAVVDAKRAERRARGVGERRLLRRLGHQSHEPALAADAAQVAEAVARLDHERRRHAGARNAQPVAGGATLGEVERPLGDDHAHTLPRRLAAQPRARLVRARPPPRKRHRVAAVAARLHRAALVVGRRRHRRAAARPHGDVELVFGGRRGAAVPPAVARVDDEARRFGRRHMHHAVVRRLALRRLVVAAQRRAQRGERARRRVRELAGEHVDPHARVHAVVAEQLHAVELDPQLV